MYCIVILEYRTLRHSQSSQSVINAPPPKHPCERASMTVRVALPGGREREQRDGRTEREERRREGQRVSRARERWFECRGRRWGRVLSAGSLHTQRDRERERERDLSGLGEAASVLPDPIRRHKEGTRGRRALVRRVAGWGLCGARGCGGGVRVSVHSFRPSTLPQLLRRLPPRQTP